MRHYDLIVAGGGPAGTAAAITAARLGAHVLLLEGGRFPRHKVCGEFVSGEAIALLENLLGPEQGMILAGAQKIAEARLFVGSSIARFPIPSAVSISRRQLDASLFRAAEIAGVECRQRVTVDRFQRYGEILNARTTIGSFSAPCAIDATGRWSKLRLDVPKNREPHCLGLKAHFKKDMASDGRPTTDLYFFDAGYCGIQPLGGLEVNVCAMVRADVATKLEDVFKLHAGLCERSRMWLKVTDVVVTAPLLFRVMQPEGGGTLRVGDAAAFIDPFAGDGISIALRSGVLASNTLRFVWSNEKCLEDAVQQYCREYRKRFARPLRTAGRLRKVLGAPRLFQALAVRAMQIPVVAAYVAGHTR